MAYGSQDEQSSTKVSGLGDVKHHCLLLHAWDISTEHNTNSILSVYLRKNLKQVFKGYGPIGFQHAMDFCGLYSGKGITGTATAANIWFWTIENGSVFNIKGTCCSCSDQLFLQILGVIAVSASVIPWILIPVLPLLIVFVYLRRYFLQTSRDVKRLESTSERRPLQQWKKKMLCDFDVCICVCSCSSSHSSKSGLLPLVFVTAGLVDHPSISGRGQVPEHLWWLSRSAFTSETLDFIDMEPGISAGPLICFPSTGAWFLFLTTSRWFAVRLDGICSVFVTVTTFACLLLRDRKDDLSRFRGKGRLLQLNFSCFCRAGCWSCRVGFDLRRLADGNVPVGCTTECRSRKLGKF